MSELLYPEERPRCLSCRSRDDLETLADEGDGSDVLVCRTGLCRREAWEILNARLRALGEDEMLERAGL